jgi:hypothetical protein
MITRLGLVAAALIAGCASALAQVPSGPGATSFSQISGQASPSQLPTATSSAQGAVTLGASGGAAAYNDSRITGACQTTGCTFTGAVGMGANQLSGSNVAITGGAINGTPIGATTPSTVAATSLSTTGLAALNVGIYWAGTLGQSVWGANQGGFAAWNFGSNGEIDFVNSEGAGSGGFNFYNTATSVGATPFLAFAISGTGGVNAYGNDALLYDNSSAQSISSATATTITGWTKVSDRLNANFNASTGVFTAPATGIYQVGGQVTYASTNATVGALYEARLVANGTLLVQGETPQEVASSLPTTVVIPMTDVSLTSGQTIVIQAYQNTGSAVALNSTAQLTTLSINRLP